MGAAGDNIEIFRGGSVLLRSPHRLLERRVIKGASSSDDDDATDVSDEHDDDEFDDDDGAKKPSANERGDDVIGAVGYYCEGVGCSERVAPPFILVHAHAGGQGGASTTAAKPMPTENYGLFPHNRVQRTLVRAD